MSTPSEKLDQAAVLLMDALHQRVERGIGDTERDTFGVLMHHICGLHQRIKKDEARTMLRIVKPCGEPANDGGVR